MNDAISLRILENAAEMTQVEQLQRLVWPGDDIEVIPLHLLITAVHNGGLVIGAYAEGERLVGFTFGFPGLYDTPDGPRPKHCSHMLGVHPDYRDRGLGYLLKRAQWQMVRHQGLDRITWTYDPLLSRNAHLNITRLGAVCNTYLPNVYGNLRDALNAGLPTDRFQVDWWVNSQRVVHRLSRRARRPLDLAHYLAGGTSILNTTHFGPDNRPRPPDSDPLALTQALPEAEGAAPLLLVEIPANFLDLKAADPDLALAWRLHTRVLFEDLFQRGYLATDFIYLPGPLPRSFYTLSYGEAVITGVKKN